MVSGNQSPQVPKPQLPASHSYFTMCSPSFHDPLLGARTGVRLPPRRISGAGAGGDPDAFQSSLNAKGKHEV